MRSLALIVLLSCGCGAPQPDDPVELVHQELCWGDCPSASSEVRGDRVAAGARYVVRVDNAGRLPPFTVSTSDESVLSIASATSEEGDAEHPETLVLEAGVAGLARLIFSDLDGELIDEAALEVVEPASLAHFRRLPPRPLRLMEGGSEHFYMEIHDDAGQRLLGFGAIEYSASAGTIQDARALATVWAEGQALAWPESFEVTATSLGVMTIEAHAGDAALMFDIEVVDSAAVSEIRLEPGLSPFPFTDRFIQASAFTADGGKIRDPECRWTWNEAAAPGLVSAGRNTIRFTDDEYEGSVEVTCSIDEVSASSWL